MTNRQIGMLAGTIFSEYYYLTIADFKVCFRNGILGYYGKLFDRFDIMIVLDWIETYLQERAGVSVSISESNKGETGGVKMPKEIAEKLKELEMRLLKDRLEKNTANPTGKYKYASLADYFSLNNIEAGKPELLEYWKGLYENADGEYISVGDFLKAKAVELLYKINNGKELGEEVKIILNKNK